MPKQKCIEPLFGDPFQAFHVFSGSCEILYRFLFLAWAPDRGEFPSPGQPRQRFAVMPIHIHQVARFSTILVKGALPLGQRLTP